MHDAQRGVRAWVPARVALGVAPSVAVAVVVAPRAAFVVVFAVVALVGVVPCVGAVFFVAIPIWICAFSASVLVVSLRQ